MRISTRGSYSLEALLVMALQGEGKLISTKKISKETGVSSGYLEQLFIPLKKAGIIVSIRGVQGGYSLAKPRKEITAGDIFRAVERDLSFEDNLKKDGQILDKNNKAHLLWQKIFLLITSCADNVSLHDLVTLSDKEAA